MLPKLSDRADARCEAHILRHFPAWKQIHIRETGEGRSEFDDFVMRCKGHLSSLCERITEGERPCIDTGWPKLNETTKNPDKVCNLEKAIEEQRARADAAEAKLTDREVSGEREGFDLSKIPDELLREAQAFGDAQAFLTDRYKKLHSYVIGKHAFPGLSVRETQLQHSALASALFTLKNSAVEVL